MKSFCSLLIVFFGAAVLSAQDQPGLFFREDWKEIPAETPVTQAHVGNRSLLLAVYGPGKAGIRKSHHDKPADDPYYIWSGECRGNWAITLRDMVSLVDLTGRSRIRWRTQQAGFHQLHIILKLVDGSWLISDEADGPSIDWRVREFNIANIRWRSLTIDKVIEGEWVDHPDLTRVDEIGWTDLMIGGGSSACSRLDWIEVYGKPVQRP